MNDLPKQDLGSHTTSISLMFDEECGVFVVSFHEGDNIVFQVKMAPDDFERLTSDMVKCVKNYNLCQAVKYIEKSKEISSSCDPCTNCKDQKEP